MVRRRLSRIAIIDAIIAEATFGGFKGDKRDGETPPITIQKFTNEMARYGAKGAQGAFVTAILRRAFD